MNQISALFFSLAISTLFANPLFSQNNALSFDGVNDYIELNSVTTSLAGSTNFTVEFWMKADRLDQPDPIPAVTLFAINTNTPVGSDGLLVTMGSPSSQTGEFAVGDEGGLWDFQGTSNIGDNICHHIAYVRDGSVGLIYIDGVLVGSHNTSFVMSSSDRFSIGQDWDNMTTTPSTSQFIKADFEEFRIWNVSRTTGEIQANLNNDLTGNEPNLLGYYNFNQGVSGGDNTGISTVIDNSSNSLYGNLNGFTLNGSTSNFVEAPCGAITPKNALNFDGINDYLEMDDVANVLAGSTNFTIEFWMKADRFNQNGSIPVVLFAMNTNIPSGSDGIFIFMGGQSSQTGNVGVFDELAWANDLSTTTNIGDNNCHHIAYVRDGNNGDLYVDGLYIGSHTTNYTVSNTDKISIGQDWDNLTTTPSTSQFYNGNIDDFRIWSVSRSQSEIQTNMNNELIGNESNLLTYYDFNQGISGGDNAGVVNVMDNSSNSFNGNLNGFALNGVTSNFVEAPCGTIAPINALNFDGIDDYVELNTVAPVLANSGTAVDFTIEFWMKADSNVQVDNRTGLFSINNSLITSNGANRFLIMLGGDVSSTSNHGRVVVSDGSSSNDFVSNVVVGDNTCHHIAYSHDAGTGSGTIYVDGVNIGSFVSSIVLAEDDLYSLGQEWDNPNTSQFYNGNIDDFRIWNVSRSQSEIQTNMNNELIGNESNLLTYYNFNQGVSGGNNVGIVNVMDNSSNSFNGILNGFTLNGATSNFVLDSCNSDIETSISSLDFNETQDAIVYPNPTLGMVNLQMNSKGEKQVTIINTIGEAIVSEVTNSNKITFDISMYPSGLYFVIINTGSNSETIKIIKK